jgi:hypothetical protein
VSLMMTDHHQNISSIIPNTTQQLIPDSHHYPHAGGFHEA